MPRPKQECNDLIRKYTQQYPKEFCVGPNKTLYCHICSRIVDFKIKFVPDLKIQKKLQNRLVFIVFYETEILGKKYCNVMCGCINMVDKFSCYQHISELNTFR